MAVPTKFDFPLIWMSFFSFQVGLATAIRYSLGRRAFSVTPNGPEVLLLDYPSHQRRLLPLLAKS
jgi:acyl-CoA oxidase